MTLDLMRLNQKEMYVLLLFLVFMFYLFLVTTLRIFFKSADFIELELKCVHY